MLQHLFPCRFNEPRCQDSRWGCRCGKGGSKKAEQRADDLAKQQAAQAAATQQAVEAKTAPTPQEQARINATFGLEQQRLPVLQARAGAVPEDLIRQLGPESAQYLDLISKRMGQSPEQLFGGTSQAASDLQAAIGQRLNAPPTIPFEDVFNPEYQLLRQNVLSDAARRGFGTGSGLEIEQLGRTGVELAIRQAGLRQQNAQINQQLRQQSLEDAAQLVRSQYGLGQEARQEGGNVSQYGAELSQQARAELANYLTNQQNLSEAARGRQTQGVVQSYAAAQPFQQNAADFNAKGLGALQNRVAQSQQGVQSIGKLAATIAAIAASGPTGGLSLAMLPMIASYGSSGGGGGSSVGGLLGGMQQANAGYGSPFGGYGGGFTPSGGYLQPARAINPFSSYRGGGGFGGFYSSPGGGAQTPIDMQELAALLRNR